MHIKKTSGGFICGEVKLAIALKLLAGGSYLDVSEIFNIDADSCYPILHKVTKEWIVQNSEFKIDIEDYLEDKDAMTKILPGTVPFIQIHSNALCTLTLTCNAVGEPFERWSACTYLQNYLENHFS